MQFETLRFVSSVFMYWVLLKICGMITLGCANPTPGHVHNITTNVHKLSLLWIKWLLQKKHFSTNLFFFLIWSILFLFLTCFFAFLPFFSFFWRFCQMNFYFRTISRGLVTEALSWPDKPSPRRRPWRRWWPEVWRRRWRTSASSPSASTLAGRYPHQSSWFRLDQSINQSSINQSSNQAINQSIIILKGISLFTGNKWELEG